MLFTFSALDQRETEVLNRIDSMKDKLKWQLHEPKRWVGSLRRLSFVRAIQGSNSIEGYDAKLDDAAAVAIGVEPLDTDSETRLALEGYRDAMTYVLQLANEPDFEYSLQLIKSLHFMMTKYHLSNRPGLWRAGSVFVRKDETGEIAYEAPDIDEVPALMTELVSQIRDAGGGTPAIVLAGMAHLNLVMIHPFRDGNGRMARCLQSLILARNGVLSPVFMSIEEYLGRNTQSYYDVLAEVGKGSWHPRNDARPWVRYVLRAHLRQATTMLRRVRESERTWIELESIVDKAELPLRAIHALFDACIGFRVRNSTYRGILREMDEEITEQTASRDLKQLVDLGLLVPDGERRGRHYVAGQPIKEVRRRLISARDPRDDTDPFAD